jgi:hypothetical protein
MSGSVTPNRLAALMRASRPNHYLHISFQFNVPFIQLKQMQDAVHLMVTNHAEDWMRYGGNCWIIWTPEGARDWVQRLNQIPSMPMNSINCVEIELSNDPFKNWGQFPQQIWDWFNRPRP